MVGLALLASALVFAMALAEAWDHTADDAYITLRYARHLANGEGVSWNPGEPAVEGYSNFLFVLLGAALLKLGAPSDPMGWLEVLGALAAFASLVMTYFLTRDLAARTVPEAGASRPAGLMTANPSAASAVGMAAVLVVVFHPGQAFWAVSGMETTVCQLFVLLAAYAVVRSVGLTSEATGFSGVANGQANAHLLLLAASGLVFLASITRPETPIVLAALLPTVVLGSSGRGLASRVRTAAWLLLPFLTLYLPYTAWRLWTFGRWLPNSAACKAGLSAEPWFLGRGFLEFAGPLLVLGMIGLALRPRREHWLLLGIPLLYFGVFRGVDPVMSHLDRHFLVTLPIVAAAAALGLHAILERLVPDRLARLTTFVVLAVAMVFATLSASDTLSDVRQAVELAHPSEALRRELAGRLEERLRPGDVLAIGDTGLVPFLLGLPVLDVYCLNCRQATEPPIDRSPERLVDWIFSKNPRYIVIQIVASASERGVFAADRALQRHPTLGTRYRRLQEFGTADDPLHYLLYERRTGGSL